MPPKQCEFMIVTRQCPNPALDGFDRCIVHLGSGGLEHWLAVAQTTGEVAVRVAGYVRFALAVWGFISPLLKAAQLDERAIEYARIKTRLDEIANFGGADRNDPKVLLLKNEVETLVIDFDDLVKSATEAAEGNLGLSV